MDDENRRAREDAGRRHARGMVEAFNRYHGPGIRKMVRAHRELFGPTVRGMIRAANGGRDAG